MKKILLISVCVTTMFADCFWRERISQGTLLSSDKYNITYMCLSGYLFVNVAWQGNSMNETRADNVTQVMELVNGKLQPKRCNCAGEWK